MTTRNISIYKEIGFKKFIPGFTWLLIILILVCTPGDKLPKVDSWLIKIDYDKLIHVGIFAVLAFLFMRPIAKSSIPAREKWHSFIKIAIATAIWGLTTELIQKFFIPSRSFDLADLLADVIGGIIAMFYCKRYFLKSVKLK